MQPLTPTPQPPMYFDYPRAARAAGIAASDLQRLVRVFEGEYATDVMLRELHILRACNAIVRGTATMAEILAASGSKAA